MKVLKTILRAFVLGIGVGVLVAPRAGSETRRMLSEKLNGVLEGASDLAGGNEQSAEGASSREVGNNDSIR